MQPDKLKSNAPYFIYFVESNEMQYLSSLFKANSKYDYKSLSLKSGSQSV